MIFELALHFRANFVPKKPTKGLQDDNDKILKILSKLILEVRFYRVFILRFKW